MTAQWPLVVAKLLAVLPTLSGWDATNVTVHDGPPDTDSPTLDYMTVGYVSDDQAGTYSLSQNDSGFQWDETGTVRCQLVCRDGETGVAGMRVRAFQLADVLETYVRSDRTLGKTLSPDGTIDVNSEVQTVQSTAGVKVSIVFTLQYTTVTP